MKHLENHPAGVPLKIKYPEMPLYEFWNNSARKFPGRDSLIYLGARYTYSKIWKQVQSFAKNLQKMGVKKGDNIGIILPNCPQFIISYYAAQLLGATVVTINPLMPKEEIEREINHTDCKILIVLDRLLDKVHEENIRFIIAEAAYYAPPFIRIISRIKYRNIGLPEKSIRFEEMIEGPPIKELADIDPKEDVAMIMFTSGTTGQPKGVMLTHYSLMANALQSYYWLRGWGYSSKPQKAGYPIILCAMPFFHSYGLVVLNEAVSFGCTLVLLPNPSIESILKSTERYGVTHFPVTPRIVKQILLHHNIMKYDLTSLTTTSSGGALIPVDDLKKFEEITGTRMYQGYGLTEAGPSICATPVEGKPNYASTGLAYPDTRIKIMDLQIGEIEISPGDIGEIVVQGPQIMKGYWKDPENTKRILKDGWLYTGDIGYLDENNYLYIIGRKKESILARGHTIWPTRVEKILNSHSKIENSVAFGIPDPLRCSTDIRAGVKLVKGVKATPQLEKELLTFCQKRLHEYEIPTRILFWDDLPMTPMGKIDRIKVLNNINKKIKELMRESKIPKDYP
jgi:long-chain acyl-CoA synthetase